MRKLLFGISLVISLIILIRVLIILVKDMERLTEYGYGYLTGLSILFVIMAGLSVFTGIKLFKRG